MVMNDNPIINQLTQQSVNIKFQGWGYENSAGFASNPQIIPSPPQKKKSLSEKYRLLLRFCTNFVFWFSIGKHLSEV